MKIRFWGARGSTPAPGKNNIEFGGNTSCVEVTLAGGHSIIIDAGTGIRLLGFDYMKRPNAPRDVHIFISHAHWDHIQGFPFFVPIFIPGFTIHVYSHLDAEEILSHQMMPPYFPVQLKDVAATLVFHRLGKAPLDIAGARVSFCFLNHPQEVYGFRISEGAASVVYASDNEHDNGPLDEALVKFSRGADALLYDAQYTPEQYGSGRAGWGHSTYSAAAAVAARAEIKKLVLFHHEPTHDDQALRQIEESAKKLFPETVSAREGMELVF